MGRVDLKGVYASRWFRAIKGVAAELGVGVYLAGGGLRDLLLGRGVNDLDFALDGAVAEFTRLFAERMGGSLFWLDEERLQARVVKKGEGAALTFDFAPLRGANIEEDLFRRDFTINAMAVELGGEDALLVDPLGGSDDLGHGIIRACSESSFSDDPLRLLRALRFAATLGFAVEGATWGHISQNAHLLEGVAAERVRDELFRILAAPGVGASLSRLRDSGLMTGILSWDLSQEASCPALDLHIDTAAGVERIAEGLKRYFPDDYRGLAEYLNREVEAGITVLSLVKLAAFLCGFAGPHKVAAVAFRLRLGRKTGRMLARLCSARKPLFEMLGKRPSSRALYRFFKDQEPAGPGLVILALAGKAASQKLCAGLITYYFGEYGAVKDDLLLSGEEVMHILGISQGVGVGEAMERLREAESAGLVNSRAEARAYLTKNLLTKEAPIG